LKQGLIHLLKWLYFFTGEKPKSNTSVHVQASTVTWFIQFVHNSECGDGQRQKADAINYVSNFNFWNAKITEVWNNYPDTWHRHGLGRLSLPELLHCLHSENTARNEVS